MNSPYALIIQSHIDRQACSHVAFAYSSSSSISSPILIPIPKQKPPILSPYSRESTAFTAFDIASSHIHLVPSRLYPLSTLTLQPLQSTCLTICTRAWRQANTNLMLEWGNQIHQQRSAIIRIRSFPHRSCRMLTCAAR